MSELPCEGNKSFSIGHTIDWKSLGSQGWHQWGKVTICDSNSQGSRYFRKQKKFNFCEIDFLFRPEDTQNLVSKFAYFYFQFWILHQKSVNRQPLRLYLIGGQGKHFCLWATLWGKEAVLLIRPSPVRRHANLEVVSKRSNIWPWSHMFPANAKSTWIYPFLSPTFLTGTKRYFWMNHSYYWSFIPKFRQFWEQVELDGLKLPKSLKCQLFAQARSPFTRKYQSFQDSIPQI